MISNEDELQDLLVNFKAFKKDFKHFLTEHYNIMQKMVDGLASRTCRCYNFIQPGGGESSGDWFRGHSFIFRRVPSISTGSGSSSAPDLNSVSSSEDKGSFKTLGSEMQGVKASSGCLDATGGVDPSVGVGAWDGSGEVGVGEGSGEVERASPSGLV